MSREPRPTSMVLRPGAAALLVAGLALGCGRGDGTDAKSVGRAGADSVWRAPGLQAGNGAAAPPTAGFTSAQGTPAAQPAPAIAPAAAAERIAPPPPPAIAARMRTEEQASLRNIPAGDGRDLVVGSCIVCHSATMITQQHKDTTGWNKTVTQMVAWGASVPTNRQAALVAYLAANFPPRADGTPARQVP
jgi:cytochrome c5